ncbi:hypothetical protein I7I50_08032 [Histoplasma capsulatum G186AR]|uniref:Uncharacterized protein n=1 Tax=Ajellomyces capsulatus TaxID=5037 RepID=A0A8H8CWG0_AJECA|nr:hypothetical protein I7I52_08548 [Histoplasma capsulatum]QSS68576.1 hypothetical protein I7I50_08032 [Histoplasma capsulatum G186AR]
MITITVIPLFQPTCRTLSRNEKKKVKKKKNRSTRLNPVKSDRSQTRCLNKRAQFMTACR